MQTFSVTNFKGIVGTVEVSVDGGSVIVSGKNAQGKSSFIEGVEELFAARGIRFIPQPINAAAEEAEAFFEDTELNLRIERKWKRNKHGEAETSFKVKTLEGKNRESPSTVVAELLGGILFDPSKFLTLDPKPQRDELLRRVILPFDLAEIEAEEAAAEVRRTGAGQVARAAEGAVTNADRPAPGTPAEPVSTSDLVAKLEEARTHNSSIRDLEARVTDGNARVEVAERSIARLKAELEEAIETRNALVETVNKAAEQLAGRTPVDTTDLEEKLRNVDEINKNVQLGQILRKLEGEAAGKRAEWKAAEAEVAEIRQRKDDGLKQAIFPHPSLSVSEEGVLFDGVAFRNVNIAQREEAAFAIATAGNPDLKVVVMKNGDFMDEDSLARIDALARERGYTLLIERGRPDVGGLIAEFVEMKDGQRA